MLLLRHRLILAFPKLDPVSVETTRLAPLTAFAPSPDHTSTSQILSYGARIVGVARLGGRAHY